MKTKKENSDVIFSKKMRCSTGAKRNISIKSYKNNRVLFVNTLIIGFECIDFESELYNVDNFIALLSDIKEKYILPFNNSYILNFESTEGFVEDLFKINITKKRFGFGKYIFLTVRGSCCDSGDFIIKLSRTDIDKILNSISNL